MEVWRMGKARDLRKEAAWRRRVDQQAVSGQSVRAWCRRHRVQETAFHWWRREVARRDAEEARVMSIKASREACSPGATFVPVHVTDDPMRGGDSRIEILLTDGRRVRVTGMVNREMLTEVLDVLERRLC